MKNLFLFSFITIVGCGRELTTKDVVKEQGVALEQEEIDSNIFAVADQSKLPKCNEKREGFIYKTKEENMFFNCQNGEWVEIDMKGIKGEKGERGEKGEKGDQGIAGINGIDNKIIAEYDCSLINVFSNSVYDQVQFNWNQMLHTNAYLKIYVTAANDILMYPKYELLNQNSGMKFHSELNFQPALIPSFKEDKSTKQRGGPAYTASMTTTTAINANLTNPTFYEFVFVPETEKVFLKITDQDWGIHPSELEIWHSRRQMDCIKNSQ